MEILRLLSVNEIAAQIISFLLLFFVLRIFVWKRLLKLIDERRERIAAEFKNIEDTKESVAKLKSDYEARLNTIDLQAREKIKQAVEAGRSLSEDLKRQAQLEAQKIIEQGREDIKYELLKVKQELKEEVVDLAIRAAEEVILERLTEVEDKRLVRDFLDKIDTMEHPRV